MEAKTRNECKRHTYRHFLNPRLKRHLEKIDVVDFSDKASFQRWLIRDSIFVDKRLDNNLVFNLFCFNSWFVHTILCYFNLWPKSAFESCFYGLEFLDFNSNLRTLWVLKISKVTDNLTWIDKKILKNLLQAQGATTKRRESRQHFKKANFCWEMMMMTV